eukprot:scaffold137974_cov31-Tisochrysis_lutea.AAC.2
MGAAGTDDEHLRSAAPQLLAALQQSLTSAAGWWKIATGARLAHAAAAEKPPERPRSMADLVMQLALRERQVFVSGTINDESAKSVIAQLLYLENAQPGAPISVLINSGGGKVHAGLAIHDVMRSISSPVHTTCLGHCESMAAVLLAAGEPGFRRALPNCRVMVHQPTRTAGGASKTSKQLLTSAAETEKTRIKLAALLARDTGRSVEEIESLLEYDTYYSAEEAQKMGLVDIIGGAELAADAGKATSDTGTSAKDATDESK